MIMGHCHLFPCGLGEERREECGIPGTADHLSSFLDACGFERAVVLAPHESPEDPSVRARIDDGDPLEWLLGQGHVGTGSGSPLTPAATIRPDLPGAAGKLQRARALGVRFLKVHPIIQRCDMLSPRCEAFWREAESARMAVVCHTGGGDWGWTAEGARPESCAELAARYPRLPILMAHCGVFGGESGFERALSACEERPNLYLETTAALLPVGGDSWKGAIERLGAGRVVYGNDYPWASRESVEKEVEFLDSLGLSPEERGRILGGNLAELWEGAAP